MREVQCCSGAPYLPVSLKANVQIDSDNVVRVVRPVLYEGRLIKMVIDVFE